MLIQTRCIKRFIYNWIIELDDQEYNITDKKVLEQYLADGIITNKMSMIWRYNRDTHKVVDYDIVLKSLELDTELLQG